jgi:hypothetical protein
MYRTAVCTVEIYICTRSIVSDAARASPPKQSKLRRGRPRGRAAAAARRAPRSAQQQRRRSTRTVRCERAAQFATWQQPTTALRAQQGRRVIASAVWVTV